MPPATRMDRATVQGDPLGPVEPHPAIAGYYVEPARRAEFVRELFNDTAADYDRINRLFSFGMGAQYRRRCLLEAGLRSGLRVIDVAVGTGLLAREAVAVTGDRREVIGVDPSEAMLAVARSRLGIPLVQGTAEALPLVAESADFVTLGYALRHVADLITAFREFHRVLRPGGTVLLLEIAKPGKQLNRLLASFYLGQVVPFLCRWTSGGARTRTLMQYHWETIEHCVPPPVILRALGDSGFRDLRCTVDFDLFRSYSARKAPQA